MMLYKDMDYGINIIYSIVVCCYYYFYYSVNGDSTVLYVSVSIIYCTVVV